ncbi:hypothetical protein G6M89_07640 [Natronolimnobius sp. AArcel1]|uniref:hypothetical protein n=1 Tax=Natronolimnobius sp. AArcel1 TaxID=1679093 RepID=UPI0013ED7822|nr:hypothetical protein [Natronolimnobius sp. AArcel1]NGM68884.1 hypothetical protein [Natronolimnobius sp. AArcel1]
MTPSDSESPPDSTGPPDRQTLQLLERQLASDPLVSTTAFDPDSYEPRLLSASLERDRYPESIPAARVDIRWFTTADFTVHYIEAHDDGSQWECRWDRHPNTHNSRLHFHQPPTATQVTDLDLPSLHPLEVYSTVLTAIEQRLETVWSD